MALKRAFRNGTILWHQDEVQVVRRENVRSPYELETALGSRIKVDRILLATGFTPQRPGGAMIDRLIDAADLKCADCGYPMIDRSLRWGSNIYTSGPLAELEIGPVSRNIAGAMRAADRITQELKRQQQRLKKIS